jgi:hypothetical protein
MNKKHLGLWPGLVWAALGSLVGVGFGLYLVPLVAAGWPFALWQALLLGLLGFVALSVWAALFLRSVADKHIRRGFGSMLAAAALLFAVLGIAAVPISLVFGLLAALLGPALAGALGAEGAKQALALVSGAAAALGLPLWLAALFGCGYAEGGILAGVGAGLRGLRRRYGKLLLITAAGLGIGYAAEAILRPWAGLWPVSAARWLLLGAVGTAGLWFCWIICGTGEETVPE